MALKKSLAQRLFSLSKISNHAITDCRISSSSAAAKVLAPPKSNKSAPDPGDDGIFRRFLHRRPMYQSIPALPELRSLPTGEKLLQKLRGMDIARERIRLDGLIPPSVDSGSKPPEGRLTVEDARKLLRLAQLESVKSRLRQLGKNQIPYSEFMEICCEGRSGIDRGRDLARMLDESGCVIVLGNVVHLRPDQVVKAIQSVLPRPVTSPDNNPRMRELEEMEKEKANIDGKAESLVRRELWCGLGYLVVQTAAFMRLTFWELSWDVMEPICFYVTSMYFMAGYAFFLRTSKEPSFEGFFQSRFSAKQKRLMKQQGFDLHRYNELKKACYPHLAATQEKAVSFASSQDEAQRIEFCNVQNQCNFR